MAARYFLVGGGIAGTLLADALVRRGCRVTLWDDDRAGTASRAAAGLLNPLTGMRFTPLWKASEVVGTALECYRRLERETGRPFFRPFPIRRWFRNAEEAGRWDGRRGETDVRPWVRNELAASPGNAVRCWGGVEIQGGGYLDFKRLISTKHNDKVTLKMGFFEDDKVQLKAGMVQYGGEEADRLVYCQGYCRSHRWWGDLRWKPAKGETLEVVARGWPVVDAIFNRGGFAIPLGGGHYRIGATYVWDDLAPETSAGGRRHLLGGASDWGMEVERVAGQCAGVRPIMRDSMPVLGPHPAEPRVVIFNGLGSKGGVLAPYCAAHLAAHLEEGAALEAVLDVRRNTV